MDFDKIYAEQIKLNERCGVTVSKFIDDINGNSQSAGIRLNDYIMAVSSELEELKDCTNWKHWCKEAQQGKRFEINDLQNARVEVTDLFFFWMSLAQCVGLTPDMIEELYYQKLGINHSRQDRGRTMKDEQAELENKTVFLVEKEGAK